MASKWRTKALKEWSRIVREVGKCEICGRKGVRGKTQGWTNLDAHHLIPKGTSSEYAPDLSNGLCLCVRCHQWDTVISPHQNRGDFEMWLKLNRLGQWKWYNEHYPFEGEKMISGKIIKCRVVKKTPAFRQNWRQAYETLKEIKEK